MNIDNKGIWKEVKDNHVRLDSCAGPHDFQSIDSNVFNRKYKCSKCNGTTNGVNKSWYDLGLKHGRL